MSSIDRAKALLAAASLQQKCGDVIRRQACKSCDEWWPTVMPARHEIARIGFNHKSFAQYIGAVEALEAWESGIYIAEWKRMRRRAIAEFAKLFPPRRKH